jgi:hypothetical protein
MSAFLPSVPPCGQRARASAWFGFALLCAVLAACGGSNEAAVPGEVGRDEPQSVANLVVPADGAQARVSGTFEKVSSPATHGEHALRHATGGPASVQFPLAVPRRGFYEVFVSWPQALPDAGEAQVEVRHVGGTTALTVDQRVGGEWRSLGFFEFDPVREASVTMRKLGTAPLYADAVRAQYAGAQRPPLQWRGTAVSVGLKDVPYQAFVTAAGGASPYRFAVTEGSLPPGLSLDPSSGEISGRPALAGRYGFTLSVRDDDGRTLAQSFELTIDDSAAGIQEPAGLEPRASSVESGREHALSVAAAPDLSNLLNVVAAMPEGSWSKVNLNKYSDVWTPADLRPLYGNSNPTPSKIILAWSGFAWDSNRAKLMLYGGGHANYRGNDVYAWNGATRLWERAALPSDMRQDALGNWNAIDGVGRAPAAAHTYDNTMFFPLVDRLVVLGGAADANGGHYLTQATATTSRKSGPYLFDPARADGNKVGGSTGSHVKRVAPYPNVVGGDMWSNREAWLNANVNSAPPSESFVNGCTGVTVENGKDVAYARTAYRLYRYEMGDLANAASDKWRLAGRYQNGSGGQASCTVDTQRRLFVSTNRNNAAPFNYWNIATASSSNNEVYFTPGEASGEFAQLLASNAIDIRYCGLEHDPRRTSQKLWCGDGRVWTLTPPATPSPSGWVLQKAPTPVGAVPAEGVGTGILGKWKYIPNLDAFMALTDPVLGNIWIYKPVGWVNPNSGNMPPSVSLTQPSQGATFTAGATIALAANASDIGGSVTKVEFFAGTTKIGEAAAAPYTASWLNATQGSHVLTAVATDNDGAQGVSPPVGITVNPSVPTNTPPQIQLTQPTAGATFVFGNPISIAASASDPGGSVAKVEFFAGALKIGEALQAPFEMVWSTAPLGASSLTARATDDAGASATSAAIAVTVQSSGQGGSVVLQRGAPFNPVVADTYLSSYHKTLAFGAASNTQDQREYYTPLLRFAIFQSEGGPVPQDAVVTSAILSVYKYSSYDMTYTVHRMLRAWTESTATWNAPAPGAAWAVAGANGAGTDYAAVADATASTGFEPGWIHFNVTDAVVAMNGTPSVANLGWRLRGTSGYTTALKKFHASEATADASLRPKLVVTYQ